MTPSDISRLVEVGSKLERLARGESTDNQSINGEIKTKVEGTLQVEEITSMDLSGLTDEELSEVEGLFTKIFNRPKQQDKTRDGDCQGKGGEKPL